MKEDRKRRERRRWGVDATGRMEGGGGEEGRMQWVGR